ncbi:MAG: LemA family protein [Candidatus Cloacimonetes bacterium]|nr:LemA family protein [Candidatus Cloacimonadota bacterium]
MGIALVIFFSVFAIIFFIIFNRFIKLKNDVYTRWKKVNLQLKLRHELVLSLIKMSKKYLNEDSVPLKHISVIQKMALSETDLEKMIFSEKKMLKELSKLILILKQDPATATDFKLHVVFNKLNDIEKKIANYRKNYNYGVKIYNEAHTSFPGNVIAFIFRFHTEKKFKLSKK